MKITFNGTVIVTGPDFGGFDAVQGFDPDSTPITDWSEPLRAPFAIPIDQGNAKTTIAGTFLKPPEGSAGASLQEKAQMFQDLPASGDLVLEQDGLTVTWANAVRGPGRVMKDVHGVSWGYQMTFYAGVSRMGPGIADSGGGTVEDSTGGAVGDSSA